MASTNIEKGWFTDALNRRIADITVEYMLTERNKSQLTKLRLARPNALSQIDQLEKELDATIKAQLDSIKALKEIEEKIKSGEKEIYNVGIFE